MTDPRPSATLCCLRQTRRLEILMVKRSETARFMASTWVFPGGAVDPVDREPTNVSLLAGAHDPSDVPWMLAAMRELVEEVGIWLTRDPHDGARLEGDAVYAGLREAGAQFDGSALGYFANWVTPSLVPVRFDARFYAAVLPAHIEPHPDLTEIADAMWIAPRTALDMAEAGEMSVPLPTQAILSTIDEYRTAGAFVAAAQALESVDRIEPRMRVGAGGSLEVLMPDHAEYDDVDTGAPPEESALRAAIDRAAIPELNDSRVDP